MSRNSTLGRGAALAALALAGAVAASLPGPTRAALPPGGASAPPLIIDRLHHLSGVIAVPPARMMAAVRPAAPGFGLLTPPTFGPNVDASLNNPAAQNETTIAINPEDDQRVIAAANDYRANLKPYVYLSTDGGTTWVNYAVPGVNSAL